MINYEPSKFEIEHSLIQKAVRRDNVELVEKLFKYLLANNQKNWLKDRLVVMVYEECWSYAEKLDIICSDGKLLEQYKFLTSTIKNKNACGLAELALKSSEGKLSFQCCR
jgi:hypothetical protein